jgi:hypothetical protein
MAVVHLSVLALIALLFFRRLSVFSLRRLRS